MPDAVAASRLAFYGTMMVHMTQTVHELSIAAIVMYVDPNAVSVLTPCNCRSQLVID